MSDYTKRNIEHFDKRAATYDTSHFKQTLSKKCSKAFLQADDVEWDPNSIIVVDFACGTGLISQDLVPHAGKIIGLDTSQAMVDVYNQKATNSGVSSKMFALCTDILSSSEIPQELRNVDVVVCSMAYHHIEDIGHTSKVLASLLKKGGHLLVVDLLQSPSTLRGKLIVDEVSGKFHNHGHPKHDHGYGHEHNENHAEHLDGHTKQSVIDTVPHIGGLSIERLEQAFTSTGLLENVVAKNAFLAMKEGTDFSFVLATGRRM